MATFRRLTGRPAATGRHSGNHAADLVGYDALWEVDTKGLVTRLDMVDSFMAMPEAVGRSIWRLIRLDTGARRDLAVAVARLSPVAGLRGIMRGGPWAGRCVFVTGRPHRMPGGAVRWSGTAMVASAGACRSDGQGADTEPREKGNSSGGTTVIAAMLAQLVDELTADCVVAARIEGDMVVSEFSAGHDRYRIGIVGRRTAIAGTVLAQTLAAPGPVVVENDLGKRHPLNPMATAHGIVAFAGMAIRDGDGRPVGVLAVWKRAPIDDPRPAEAALRRAVWRIAGEWRDIRRQREIAADAARLRASLDAMPAMFYQVAVSPEGARRFLYVGGGIEQLLGETAESVCRWPAEKVATLFSPMADGEGGDSHGDGLRRGEAIDKRWRLRRPDGREVALLARERAIDRGGSEMMVVGVMLDESAAARDRQMASGELDALWTRMAAIAEATPDWECWTDGDGELLWVNGGADDEGDWATYRGRPAGFYPRPLVAETDRAVFDAAVAAARGGRTVTGCDLRILRPSGGPVWHSLAVRPVFVGGSNGLRISLRPIDERKRGEQRMAEDVAALRRIVDSFDLIDDGFVVADRDGRVTYANRAAAIWCGYDAPGPMMGSHWRELGLAPSPGSPLLDVIESSLVGRGRWHGEISLPGRNPALLLETDFIRLEDGGFVAAMADIGPRRLIEERAREGEERYRALFQSADDAIFLMEGARIVDCNPRAEDMFGRPRASMLGEIPHAFAPPLQPDGRPSRQEAADHIAVALAGMPCNHEWLGQRADGTPLILDISLTSLSRRGTPYLFALIRDITDRRRREEERLRLEATLQEARKLEALGRFAGGIAHDFNNIVGAIRGFAELIGTETAPPPVERYAHRIVTACERASALTRQILTFTRRAEPVRRPVDMAPLVQECCDLLRPGLSADIDLVCDADRAMVSGDRTQLGQVVVNLVVNAGEALSGEAGRIAVSVRPLASGAADFPAKDSSAKVQVRTDSDGAAVATLGGLEAGASYVLLSVADSGTGVPAETLGQAFDPFFTTKGLGTGLGLAVVREVVLGHGGAVLVRSRPGAGTRFDIALPVAGAVEEREAPPEDMPPPPIPVLPSGLRVLLVDDNADFTDMVLMALERQGIEGAACASPVEALAIIVESPDAWDVVVSDQGMPQMSGLDFVKEIKAVRSDLPCLLCTGQIGAPEALDLATEGVITVLRKPVALGDLFTAIIGAVSPISDS